MVIKRQEIEKRLTKNIAKNDSLVKDKKNRDFTKEQLLERKRELLKNARMNVKNLLNERKQDDEQLTSMERKTTPTFVNLMTEEGAAC